MDGGLAGLVLAILVGKRANYPKITIKPMSVMLTALGAALLWFRRYGFNAGSAFWCKRNCWFSTLNIN